MTRLRRAGTALALVLALGVPLGCGKSRDTYLERAHGYIAEGKDREALIELRNALKMDPQHAETNFQIAQALMRLNNAPAALFFFRETNRLDPERTDAALIEANLLVFDDPERATELVDGVLKREPDNAKAYIVRSKLLVSEGNPDVGAALRAALTATELAPDEPEAFQQLGTVHAARVRRGQVLEQEVAEDVFASALGAYEREAELRAAHGQSVLGAKLRRARLLAAWPGRVDEARADFLQVIQDAKEHEDRGEVMLALTETLRFARERRDVALLTSTLEDLAGITPGNLRVWMTLASLEDQREDGAGEAVYRRLLAERESDPESHRLYAMYLLERGRADEAIAHLEEVAGRGVAPPVVLGALTNLLYGLERYDEAAAVVERLEREYPKHPRTVLARAQQATRERQIADAVVEVRRLAGEVEFPAVQRMLAGLEHKLGNHVAALAAVERSIELSRRGVFPADSFRLRARIQASLGDWTGVLHSFRALDSNGRSLDTMERLLRVDALYALGRARLARRVLDQLLESDPRLPVVLSFAKHEGANQPIRVRQLLEGFLTLIPGHPALLAQLASLDMAAGDADSALTRLNAALEQGYVTPALLFERARVLAARGELEAAQRDALQAFDADPSMSEAALFMVRLYQAQNRVDEAIASLEQAAAAGALQAPARLLLANLHMRGGNTDRARDLLEQVLAERSDLPAAKNDLAFLLARKGADLDRALRLAQEAQTALSGNSAVADTLGYVYLRKGLYEPALDQFRRALDLAPEGTARASYHHHLGLALRALGRDEEAEGSFERALALDAGLDEATRELEKIRAARGASSGANPS